ncbi:hypothetical protein FHT44_004920 [Mycolicibacterium sp. BK634]|nr:hypothetical protein [Mycolicibacterium sp. BK634]
MILLLGLLAYLVIGLFFSRWAYRTHLWIKDGDVIWLILFWPVIAVLRPAVRFFRWFYKRPADKRKGA